MSTTKLTQQEILPLPTDIGALGNRINFATRSEHNKIDRTVTLKFALALRDGRIYRQGIQAFYHVFKNVEILIERELNAPELSKTGEILQEFWKPEIARRNRLFKDLMFFYHNEPSKFEEPIRSEQIDFVKHIYSEYEKKPHILIAYCHVMYLALFAGGRLMRSSLAKATGLFPQMDGKTTAEVSEYGTNFFKFDVEDENVLRVEYKRDYELSTRNKLTEEEKLDIISESKEIFKRNLQMIQEIESHNKAVITGKLGYKVFHYGYYVAVVSAVVVVALVLRRVASHLVSV